MLVIDVSFRLPRCALIVLESGRYKVDITLPPAESRSSGMPSLSSSMSRTLGTPSLSESLLRSSSARVPIVPTLNEDPEAPGYPRLAPVKFASATFVFEIHLASGFLVASKYPFSAAKLSLRVVCIPFW